MVGGGGPANFFGAPHRRAILMDNSAELTAGALRSKPQESIESAKDLFFTRGYPSWEEMAKGEAALPESERIDYVTIVTPNDAHFGPAEAAAAAGIGVLCEKPLTTTLDEARRLHASVRAKDAPFVTAYIDLKEGDRVLMLYGAANRDETVFDNPDGLDLTRDPNPHLGFGIGPHFCLGSNLAKAEIRVVLQELFRRLPDITVPEGVSPSRGDSTLVLALQELPATFTKCPVAH